MIALLGVLLWGGEYVRRDLWAPDEARYALVSREMRDGHWLVPFRQGEFYSHKPPLMFWLTNVFSVFTGGEIGNVAPRLPSYLGAMLALWAATRLAARWFSTQAAWMTFLLLPSSFLFWNKGGFGQIDMLLCGLEMMALYFLFTSNGRRAAGRLALAYLFMGLGILAKGPVGFVIPLGVYFAGTWAAGESFARPRAHWWWGPLITLSLPGAWLLAAWWQGAPEGFFPELLFKQNVGRLSGEFGGHIKPFYYFLQYFPLDFLPWTFALPLSWVALKRFPEHDAGRKRLLAWMVFVVLFFSLSASKRNLYILLAYPAAAMLVAAGAGAWLRAPSAWLRRTYAVLSGFIILLGTLLTVASFLPQIPFRAISLLPAGLLFFGGAAWTHSKWRAQREGPAWLKAMAISILAGYAAIGAVVYHEIDDLKTPDEIIAVARDHLSPEERIITYRWHGEIISLYAGRKGRMVFSDGELAEYLATSPQTNHMIVALERWWPELQAVIGDHHVVNRFESGSKDLIWVTLKRDDLLQQKLEAFRQRAGANAESVDPGLE